MRHSILSGVILLLAGCASVSPIDTAITTFDVAARQVQLGDPISKVMEVLGPSQDGLASSQRKRPDEYLQDGARMQVLYFRSSNQPDGITTDDEFTPYVFKDGKLAAIGWVTLGGPKTQAQPVPHTNVDVFYPYWYPYPYPYRYPY
jgi:hypothetical protein